MPDGATVGLFLELTPSILMPASTTLLFTMLLFPVFDIPLAVA